MIIYYYVCDGNHPASKSLAKKIEEDGALSKRSTHN